MNDSQRAESVAMVRRVFADRPTQTPAEWCCEHVEFDEPDNRGPFSLLGREYMREVVDSWGDPDVTDLVQVFGSQSGKTGGIMGGAAWTIVNEPSRIFWVMPTMPTVKSFSRTRWQPMLRRTQSIADMIPTGADRYDFSTFDQTIGAAIVDMKWSNSPAALASIPARIVILDEVDKFNEGGSREANAVNLSEQRTKSFANPKRIKTSTPTLVSGLIWQEFLKTDQRRRYVPCPHCGRFVVLIWSKAYTVFKLTGDEAEAVWDKRAKGRDGRWDLERVATSAHYRCPHCAGQITDAHKTLMDRGGVWKATAPAARGYRGWHLSSLYAASAQTNVGALAVKFLQAKESLLGLQGFINGDLAEPYQAQDTVRERVDVVTARQQSDDQWAKIMTIDCQAKAPHFWFVVRAWRDGVSEGLEAGAVDTWEELRSIQERHKIPDVQVAVDSGFGARSDAEVYKTCVQFSEVIAIGDGMMAVGWMPTKGMPGSKRWREEQTATLVPWYLAKIDPFLGTADAGRVSQSLFEFSGDFFKDILDKLRGDKTKWTVNASMASEEYWRHMDGEVKKVRVNARTGFRSYEWQTRGKYWPQHLWDCETAQIAVATFHKFFALQ